MLRPSIKENQPAVVVASHAGLARSGSLLSFHRGALEAVKAKLLVFS